MDSGSNSSGRTPSGAPSAARIVGFDLARALAIFGMVIVNFKTVMGVGAAGPAWLVGITGLIDGRAAAVFVTLAGIGIALGAGGAGAGVRPDRLAAARSTVLRRALFLFVLGLGLAPVWPADILHFYAVYMALAAFLLGAPPRRLVLYALLVVAGAVAAMVLFD